VENLYGIFQRNPTSTQWFRN